MNEKRASDRVMQTVKEEIQQALANARLDGYMAARRDELAFLCDMPEYDQRISDRIEFLKEEINR